MQKGIADLEKMFFDAQGDLVVLGQLRAELKHRKLARAFTLLKRVEATLAAVEQQSGAEAEPTEKLVATGFEDSAPPSYSKLSGGSREIKPADAPISESMHRATEREPGAGPEPAGSPLSQRALLTLEESCRVLGVAPASSWEVIEQARRRLVERSRLDLVAELGEEQREKAQTDARRANQAYVVLTRARMNV